MKKDVRKEVMGQVDDIFKKISEIEARIPKEPTRYVGMDGGEYFECPICYNDDMSYAMASDMSCSQAALSGKYPELAGMLEGWEDRMELFNFRLMRMIDDDEDGRPMKPWKFMKALEFASGIRDAMKAATELDKTELDDMLEDFAGRCRAWAVRVIRMNTWAYCLENMEDVERIRAGLKGRQDPDNGMWEFVMSVCNAREKLMDLLITVPADTDDYKYVMDTLDKFNRICHVVMDA